VTFTIWCWGKNGDGQLGDDFPNGHTQPIQEDWGFTNWWKVSAGFAHTCGIKSDGTLWCWGDNYYGEIGKGDFVGNQTTPLQVGSESDWQDVSAGDYHTCGIRNDSGQYTVWCWGRNYSGQLGVGDYVDRNVPTQVGTVSNCQEEVTAGAFQSCALQGSAGNGLLWCWGSNVYGQLGDGTGWYTHPVLTQTMVPIPAGSFDMGDHFDEGESDELPVHPANISAFYLDKFEVTYAQYAVCVNAGMCTDPESVTDDNKPVGDVTWEQARQYCEDWRGMRLPTEAEWEYAARGGLVGKRYPWGDSGPVCATGPLTLNGANYNACSGNPIDVGSHAPNGFGLFDMAGNVNEWVNDYYWNSYYQYCIDNTIEDDPPGPSSPPATTDRVRRGGDFDNPATNLRNANRFSSNPVMFYKSLGFRCASD